MFIPCRKGVSVSGTTELDLSRLTLPLSDGNIRYFEYENDKFEYLSEYKSADPQRGIAFLPKRGLNIHENEVMRAFKTVNDSYIEPISFIVPRRAEVFQGDIYPPVTGSRPGMTAQQWLDGKDALPPKIDLESVYAGEAPVEVPSDYKPPPPLTPMTPAPPKETKKPEPTQETPLPTPALRSPPPSMKEQGQSMSNIADKFADKEESESEEDDSSIEEVAKPAERTEKRAPPPTDDKTEVIASSKGLEGAAESRQQESAGMWKVSIQVSLMPSPVNHVQSSTQPTSTSGPRAPETSSSSGQSGIEGDLAEIKSLLQQQRVTMASQSDMILQLTSEVDTLKRAVAKLS